MIVFTDQPPCDEATGVGESWPSRDSRRYNMKQGEIRRRDVQRVGARWAGFTLVELLVVIAIIGVLVALLLPAVQAAREAARRSTCMNQFKQVGLALQNYHSARGAFPPGTEFHRSGNRSDCRFAPTSPSNHSGFGWGTFILPYLEQQTIYDGFDLKASIYTDNSWAALANLVPVYICPSGINDTKWVDCCTGKDHFGDPNADWRLSNMAGIGDSVDAYCAAFQPTAIGRGILFNYSETDTGDITDGTSNTGIVGEIVGAKGSDASGQEVWVGHSWITRNLSDMSQGINGPGTLPGGRDDTIDPLDGDGGNRHDELHREVGHASFHPGGAHFAYADGSVQFVNEDASIDVLYAWATRADGDLVNGDSASGVDTRPPGADSGNTPPPR
jgi:prepilin-type N-terminal cleavage/methylation domain-containing protein/prepilin-type processing-associated H-X9-DG protein